MSNNKKIYSVKSSELQKVLVDYLEKDKGKGHLILWKCNICKCIGFSDLMGTLGGWNACDGIDDDCGRVFCGECMPLVDCKECGGNHCPECVHNSKN
jgi:hypothetical protein